MQKFKRFLCLLLSFVMVIGMVPANVFATDGGSCTHGNTTMVINAATCTVDGSTVVTCNECGEVTSSEVATATGEHVFVNEAGETLEYCVYECGTKNKDYVAPVAEGEPEASAPSEPEASAPSEPEAEGEDLVAVVSDEPVAKVGNTEYATIDEAIANWTNGTTLTLLSDVTLSDVIKLNSDEYHILDLGTYTMTAAKNKDAIQIVNNGRTSASYALDIKADATNPGGITASGKAVVKTTGKSGVKDRPIIRFYNGVFNGTNIVYHSGSNGTNCPQFQFHGGEFNGTIYANRALFQFYGGTFNGALQISVDSSAYALISGGKFLKLSNQYGSALNSDKFTIGSAKGNFNRGIYVDSEGYYVVTSEVIEEVSAKYPAVKKESYNSNNYFYYSAAATYGMFYEVASMAGTGSNVTVYVRPNVEAPKEVVDEIVKDNEAVAADTVKEIINKIKDSVALDNYTPKNVPQGAELMIDLADMELTGDAAATKVVYEVAPMQGNTKVEPTAPITFRLPVPAGFAANKAKVYHEGDLMGIYAVKDENNAKYVEVESKDFSTYTVEATDAEAVAKIGEVGYETLIAAVAAVADGETITLVKNETFTETNRTHNSDTWYDGLYYVGDKSFTIDLGGYTIGHDGSVNDYLLNFKNDGSKANTITLKNGTIDAGTAAYCAICTSSTSTQTVTINTENIVIKNNNAWGSTVKIRGGAVLNVKAGTQIIGQNSYLCIEAVASTVNIFDDAKLYMNGTASDLGCLVGACGMGTVNVYGGYGKGDKGGFVAMTSGGTINVKGGEWIANTDGTVGNNSNLYVLTAQSNKYESGFAGPAIINVTDGTFRGGMDAWVLNNLPEEKAELNISGGNFNANPSRYMEAGCMMVENAGTFDVKEAFIEVTYADGTVELFDNMLEAVPYTTNCPRLEGATIKLLKDTSGAGMRFMENDMVFDLNGHTYTITAGTGSQGTNTSGFQIRPEVTTDVVFKNGTIKVAEGAPVVWMFNVYATEFVLENVTVDCTNMAWSYGDSCYVTVSRSGDDVKFTGNTKIENFNSAVAGVAHNIGGTMTVEETVVPGGSFKLAEGATLTGSANLTVATDDGSYVSYENGTYVAKVCVAMIGETPYDSVNAAIAAAQAGDTVKVMAGTYAMPSMKAGITIEGVGEVLFEGYLTGTLENLTLKNLHIKGSNAQRWAYAKGNLVFENVTFEATGVYALHFDGITEGATLLYKNCTIIGWAAMSGSPASCVFDGCTFKGNGTYGLVRTYFDAIIKNCTFDVANVNTNDKYQDGIHAVEGAKVTVDNCTNVNGDMKDIINIHADSVVELDGEAIQNVAKIGDTYYATVVDAFKAATSGCTIEILADVTVDGKWDCRDYATGGSHSQFKEAVTINGNGHTIKFTGTISDGNWNTIFRFEENATVQNLTIDISEATGAQRVISAKKSLTVDGLTIIGSAKYGVIFGEGSSATDLSAAEIVIKNSTLTGTRRAISDNEGGKDVKSAVITGNTLKANVYVSASESIIFNNNVASGEVDLRSYAADNVLDVEAQGNTLTSGAKNYIYAKTIDAQAEFGTKHPPIKVATKAELNAALAAAEDGDTIVMTADIDYGNEQLAITKPITLDLGGKTLTTRNAYGGMSVKNNPTIKNGTIVHASNTAAIKVWNATAFENLVIDVQGKGDANKTIGGIVLQSGSTTRVGSIKNVTIKGAALTNGIETYNCGDATENVIGSMDKVDIDAKGTGMLISAPCGTATNCSVKGGVNGIEISIKGNYSASLSLVNSQVEGGVFAHDEFSSNPNITNSGSLSLTVDENTTGADKEDITLTIARAEENVEGILEEIIDKATAKVNDTFYATLADAIAAADGETVKVLADVEAVVLPTEDSANHANSTAISIAAGKQVTLDLNGKTISVKGADEAKYDVLAIRNHGDLTITDSVGGGKLTLSYSGTQEIGSSQIHSTILNFGTLTIEGGTIENNSTTGYGRYTVNNYSWGGNANLTIKGGIISNATTVAVYADGYCDNGTNSCTVTIEGGEINGGLWYNGRTTAGAKNITVTGGTFVGTTNGALTIRSTPDTAVISGGTFNGTVSITEGVKAISGGTFTNDVSANLVDGYMVEAGENGNYGIVVDPSYGKLAMIGDQYFDTVADALAAAQEAGMTDVTITLFGETTKASALALEDTFNLYTKTAFNSVTFKQADPSTVYYINSIKTGSRTNGGTFVFDGVNIVVTGQYIFEGNVKLTNDSVVKSVAEANCFIYNGTTTIDPGSKLYGVIEDFRGGDVIVDGGRTDGAFNTDPDMQDAIMIIKWSGDSLTLKNGAYVKVNAANEVGRLTISAGTSLNVYGSKLDSYQWIENAGTVNTDVNSLITTQKFNGAGKIVIDASALDNEITRVQVIEANMSGFTGTVEVTNNDKMEYVVESDGVYVQHVAYGKVAHIGNKYYATIADALAAAQDGDVVTLIYAEGDAPIAMNGAVYGKSVTISGTATVDWSKGFLFVGRGGEGNGTVIFKDANLTSASNNASTGIHVSGREKNTNNKYDGTLIIENSNIELDYLINKGTITMDGSTLTVKNGFAVGGRPASETESGEDATATISLNNGSKLVVNNHNGMGLGYEAIGVMNITGNSTFETPQSFLVTAKGTMNVNGGNVKVTGTLTNKGTVNITDSTVKAAKLDNDYLMFLNGENTFQVEDASGSSYAIRANDGVVMNDSYIKASANETFRLLGSATFNGGFECAYLQGSSAGVGGTVTIEDGTTVNASYGVEFSKDYILNGGTIDLSGGNASGSIWGMVFQSGTYTINTNLNVDGGTSYAPIYFTNATATVNGQIKQANSNGEPLYIKNSTVTLGTNAVVDVLSLHGTDTSVLNLDATGKGVGDVLFHSNAIAFPGKVVVTGYNPAKLAVAKDAEGKIVLVDREFKGSVTPAYVGADAIWGEGGGNAFESLVVKLYEGETVIATASLNNIGGIINGNVYVTWNIPFAGSNDEYWTVAWAEGYPNISMAPDKVVMVIDGEAVATNNVQFNGPDNLNKIYAATADADGKIKYYTSVDAAFAGVQNGGEVRILVAGSYKPGFSGKNITVTGAVAGVEFTNIGAYNMGGASVTFNNVTFTYANDSLYKGLQHSGDLVYNDCTFNGQVFLYGQSETFNNCIFNTTDSNNYNVWTYGAKEVAFNECIFNSAGKSVLIYAESADVTNDVTVTDSIFNASTAVDGKAAIEMDSSLTGGITLNVTNSTATGFGNGNVSGNSLWNNKKGNNTDANNDITVVVDNETVLAPVTFVAYIGKTGYTAINAAVKAAVAGETVTIVAGSYTQNLTVNKAITVAGQTDAEGKNLVNITGSVTVRSGATVKNLNVHNEKTGTYDCALDVNGKDIVLDGVKLTGYNGMKYCYAKGDITIKNSVINASNFAVHFDGSNGGTLLIENSDITGWVSYGGYIDLVTLKNSTFHKGGYAGQRSYADALVIEGSTFEAGYKLDIAVTGSDITVTDSQMSDGSSMATLFNSNDACGQNNIKIDNESLKYVAKIGSAYYETLAAALADVKDYTSIQLVADATLDYGARDVYGRDATTDIIIDGQSMYTLTLNQTNSDWASIGLKNAEGTLTLKNMTINKSGKGATSGAWNTHAIIFSTPVEMNNVTVNNAIAVAADATLKNVTINEANEYYGLWIEANGQNVTVEGGSITATNGGRGIKIADQYINEPESVTLKVEGTKFTTAKKAAVLVSSVAGADITATNVDISGVVADPVNFVWVDEDWAADFNKVTVNDAPAAQESVAEFAAAFTDENGAVIGYYKTLQEAVNEANAGETIAVLDNVALTETLVIPAAASTFSRRAATGITLDLNGKTITGSPTAATAYEVIRNDGILTITNGKVVCDYTLNGSSGAVNAITNTGTLVVDGVEIVNTSANAKLQIGYGIDNNSTSNDAILTIKGNTKISVSGSNYYDGIRQFANSETKANSVTVEAGNVSSIWMQNPSGSNAKNVMASVAISGGTVGALYLEPSSEFEASITGGHVNKVVYNEKSEDGRDLTGFITGGTYTECPEDAMLAAGYETDYDKVNKKFVIETANVASVNGVTYASLADAIEAAKNGDTVYLTRDVVLNGKVTVPAGAKFTLNMMGYTLNGSILAPNAEMTVLNGTIKNADKTVSALEINAGKLTLTNVNVESERHALRIDGNVDATINGGEYKVIGTNKGTYHAMNVSGNANVTIKDGTFVGPKGTKADSGSAVNVQAGATVTIEGGSFSGGKNKTLASNGTLTVVGGTFDQDPTAYVAKDYKAVKNGDKFEVVKKVYVAMIGEIGYESLADALAAAVNNATIELVGDATIAMNGSVYGKTVTISGTATVDWSKGFLFVGRGGEGNGTVIFDNANLTSASNSASYGIHVSGREKNTNNKYDGTLVIKNSTIELDYLINKGTIDMDASTLTVKNGFAIGGRPASETESGADATATLNLTNRSKVIVNNHNGMGLGYEAIGVMNIDATSSFETTQKFLVTEKGTMNIAGEAKVAGTLTNNGSIVLTAPNAVLTANECGNVTTTQSDYHLVYADGAYKLTAKNYVAQIGEAKYESLQEAINACVAGDNTITLLADTDEDVTVKQTEGVNVVIDGNDKVYSGTITIHGVSRHTGEETLTLKNFQFKTSEAGHYFIDSNSTAPAERYAHNVTVVDSSFTATGAAVNSAVAMRIRQGFNIAVENVKADGLHSVLQAYGTNGIAISGLNATNMKNGISAGTSTNVEITNATITATGYGIRADGEVETELKVTGSTINAPQPIVVRRNSEADYAVVLNGNTLTGGEYAVVFTTGEDDAAYVAPTHAVNVTGADDLSVYPVHAAKIGATYYTTLQAAIDAAVAGDNTITLLADTDEDVTVKQTEGVNVVIDGNDKVYSGTITIHGASRHTGEETLTLKNFQFKTSETGHYFIDSNSTASAERYAHNVTVVDSSFTATGAAVKSAVAMRIRQGFNIAVENVKADGLHSVLQAYGTNGIAISGLNATNMKNGISAGTSTNVEITNATITADGYGIRADGEVETELKVTGSTINAPQPIVVRRNSEADYAVVLNDNTLNGGEYAVIFTTGEDDAAYVAPTHAVNVTGADDLSVYPVHAAKIGATYYTTLQAAIDAAVAGDNTITLLTGSEENVTIKQVEGVNITIDGAGNVYSGTITIHGASRHTGEETLTLKNFQFKTSEAGHYFIDSNSTASAERYAHNVTVKESTFTATGEAIDSAAAMRIRQGFNIAIDNVTSTDMHSLFQAYGNNGVKISNVTVTGKNGISVGTSTGVEITNATITADAYGIRADGTGAYDMTVSDSTIKANDPIVVRKSTVAGYKLNLSGNALVPGNTDGYHVVFTKGDDGSYEAPVVKPVVTGAEGLNIFPVGMAKIGNTYYATLAAAIEAVKNGETITLLDNCAEDVTIKQTANVDIILDGNGNVYSGTITIHGASRYDGAETLVIKNFKFETSEASHYFIDSNSTESAKRYAHNVTVENSTFTATGEAVNSAAAMRIRQGFDIAISNVTSTDMHSLLQAYGNDGITISNVTVNGKNGISAGTSENVKITNATITATGYGIRADGQVETELKVTGSTINATQPIVVRNNDNAGYKVALKGNTLTAPEGKYDVIFTTGKDDAEYVAPTHAVNVTGAENLNVFPVHAAKIGATYYTTLQAAIDAAVAGDNTITLLADSAENVTVKQAEGVNITIDGAGNVYSGTITIHGNARYEGAETLVIKNFQFKTDKAGHYFIDSNSTGSVERYAHNVTVENSTFTATGAAVNSAAAMRIRQGFNIVIDEVKTKDMHSLLQGYGIAGVTVTDVTVNGKNGISVGTSTGVEITNATITATGYGIRADGKVVTELKVTGSTINAKQPIVVRENTNADYAVALNGNTLTGNNENGYQVIFTTGDDGTYVAPAHVPTVSGADVVKVFPAHVAKIGEHHYTTLAAALAEVKNGETIVLVKDCAENVTIKQVSGKSFTIDGAGYTYTGTITINGNKRSTGAETLTFKNINFYIVKNYGSGILTEQNTYAHNITVDGCTFTGNDQVAYTYGIRLYHAYNVVVTNTTGTKLFDLIYATKMVDGLTVDTAKVSHSDNGIYAPYGKNLSFKNMDLNTSNFGVYIANNNASKATFENIKIKAPNPIILEQKTTDKAYTLTFKGQNQFIANNENATWLDVIGTDATFKVVVEDAGLDMKKTSGLTVKVGENVYYNTLTNAIKAKVTEDITVLKDDELKASWTAAQNVTVNENATLTVKSGVTLTTSESVIVNGTLVDEGATFVLSAVDATIKAQENLTVTTTVADHKVAYENGTHKLVAKVYVAEVNGVSYESLQAAVDAAQDGDTVKVIADHEIICDVNPLITVDGKNITIDLNGKDITVNAVGAPEVVRVVFQTEENAKLTMTDSVGGGSVTANGEGVIYYMFRNVGEMIIAGGNYELSGYAGGAMFFSMNSGMTVTGGMFTQHTSGWMFNTDLNSVYIITVYGGTFNRYFIGRDTVVPEENMRGEVVLGEGLALIESEIAGYWTIDNAVAKRVAGNETVKTYISLADALAEVQTGETIVLLKDIAEDLTIDGNVAIDLNGKTINGTITLANADATLTAQEGLLNQMATIDGYRVKYEGGIYYAAEVIYVAEVNGVAYESLQAAVDAAQDGDTVKVIADHEIICDVNPLITVAGKNITIDLNGKDITVNAVGAPEVVRVVFQAEENAKLTMTDSVGGGSVTANGEGVIYYMFRNVGEMIIAGGNYELSGFAGGAIFFSLNGDMTVTGGMFTQNTSGWMFNTDGNGAHKITVSGGTFNRYFIGGAAHGENIWGEVVLAEGLTLVEADIEGYWTIEEAVAKRVDANGAEIATYSTLAAALADVQNGETVVLMKDCAENVTIKQVKGLSFTIDGAGYTYTGTFAINGNKRSTGAETLTFKNINFYIVKNYGSGILTEQDTYAHNITVEGCTFTGNDQVAYTYGIRLYHAYNVVVTNTTGTKLFDLIYATKMVDGLTVDTAKVSHSDNGIYAPYGKNLSFKNMDLNTSNFGVYIANNNASKATFENIKIKAPNPIILEQKNTGRAYTLTFNGTNQFIANNSNATWLNVIGTDATFKVVVNDAGLDMMKTSGLRVKVGENVYYNTLTNAIKANVTEDITVLKDDELKASWTAAQNVTVNKNATLTVKSGVTLTTSESVIVNGTLVDEGATFVLSAVDATIKAQEDLTVTTTVENAEVVYENGTHKVAKFVACIGETMYETLTEALDAAQNGETVVVLTNIDENGYVIVDKGVTLDLNGYTVKASGVVAFNSSHIVDNSADNSGVLAVAKSRVVLDRDNAELPIWNEAKGGYQFLKVTTFTEREKVENEVNMKYSFNFSTELNAAHLIDLMKKSSTESGIALKVRVSWYDTNQNSTISQDFLYNEALVATVLGYYNAAEGTFGAGWKIVLSNYTNVKYQNITWTAVVESDTGVEMIASNFRVNGN